MAIKFWLSSNADLTILNERKNKLDKLKFDS